jgi:excisionase family DNA binding protein
MTQLPLSTPTVPEPFVSAREASQFVRLHPVTVQRLARDGTLPGHPVGDGQRRRWRFLLSELGAWLQARESVTAKRR